MDSKKYELVPDSVDSAIDHGSLSIRDVPSAVSSQKRFTLWASETLTLRVTLKGIVLAADPLRGVFAVESQEGGCAVFCQHGGRPFEAGDVLEGSVMPRGAQTLLYVSGVCVAVGNNQGLTRDEALALVRGRSDVP